MSEIKFKSVKKRPMRKRRASSGSDVDSDSEHKGEDVVTVEDIKMMQKMRNRTNGISAEALATKKELVEKKKEETDPFKLKEGGCVDMKTIKKSRITAEDLEHIGTSFAAETNRRDEDADMLKYVEVELSKRKGVLEEEDLPKRTRNPEDHLYELPENIQKIVSQKKRSEDMLSNQMLSGIPEVDLGIESKIKNIEATEEAKQQLLEERKNRRDRNHVDFVPTNMAVNFVQHNRFNIEDSKPVLKKKVEAPKPEPVRVGDVRPATADLYQSGSEKSSAKGEKATDDFHFEKFKRQLRRY